MQRRPQWWEWDLEVTWHLFRRMKQRDFTFADIRSMLNRTRRVIDDPVPGRFRALTTWEDREWTVILEPDAATRSVVVVTAFPSD